MGLGAGAEPAGAVQENIHSPPRRRVTWAEPLEEVRIISPRRAGSPEDPPRERDVEYADEDSDEEQQGDQAELDADTVEVRAHLQKPQDGLNSSWACATVRMVFHQDAIVSGSCCPFQLPRARGPFCVSSS